LINEIEEENEKKRKKKETGNVKPPHHIILPSDPSVMENIYRESYF
jgi:hypothetical protein